MRTIYELDNKNIYTGNSRQITDAEGRLPNWVVADVPPEGIAQWNGSGWVVLTERPVQTVTPPQSVTPRQMRLELLSRDLLDDIENAVTGLGSAAKIEWEYATTIERGNPLIAAIQAVIDYTDEQTDELFIAANQRQ